MLKIFFTFFLASFIVFAEDVELFEDGLGQDLDSDFAHIEDSSNHSSVSKSLASSSNYYWDERDLFQKERKFGLLSGNEYIAKVHHFSLFPFLSFDISSFYLNLGLPIRFPVYDSSIKRFSSPSEFIYPRKIEYMSILDAQRVIRHLELGHEDKNYFFRLSRFHAQNLGEGILVKDLTYQEFFDEDYLFLNAHAKLDQVGLEFMAGPIPKINVLGLNARFIPFSQSGFAKFFQDLNFDVAYAVDMFAPKNTNEKPYSLDENERLVKRPDGSVHGVAFTLISENPLGNNFFIKPYTGYSHLFLGDLNENGGGFHLGNDFSLFFSKTKPKSVMKIRTEGRLFGSHYLPNYFGPLYMLDRQIFSNGNTKSEYLALNKDTSLRFGFLLELGYLYENAFSASMSYENAYPTGNNFHIPESRKLRLGLGAIGLDSAKFYLGYEASIINEFKEVFDFDRSRGLLSGKGQIKLMPFLHFISWAKHQFGILDRYKIDNGSSFSHEGETKKFNFGLGLEFAMIF